MQCVLCKDLELPFPDFPKSPPRFLGVVPHPSGSHSVTPTLPQRTALRLRSRPRSTPLHASLSKSRCRPKKEPRPPPPLTTPPNLQSDHLPQDTKKKGPHSSRPLACKKVDVLSCASFCLFLILVHLNYPFFICSILSLSSRQGQQLRSSVQGRFPKPFRQQDHPPTDSKDVLRLQPALVDSRPSDVLVTSCRRSNRPPTQRSNARSC